jgi:hypothetical protein
MKRRLERFKSVFAMNVVLIIGAVLEEWIVEGE